MAESKYLMKKSADLTDYKPRGGYRPTYDATEALHPSRPHFDSKHHLMLR
jgi:hypothetical protein